MNTNIAHINHLSLEEATAEFTRCCGASRWAQGMADRRPFRDTAAVMEAAEALWPQLMEADWREAFSHHPKIGDVDSLRTKFAETSEWATGEQSGAAAAAAEVLHTLAEANRTYEEKFGYIFIVCATGKSAEQMLALLQARLPNAPAAELPIAAEEQKKITRLRLQKRLAG